MSIFLEILHNKSLSCGQNVFLWTLQDVDQCLRFRFPIHIADQSVAAANGIWQQCQCQCLVRKLGQVSYSCIVLQVTEIPQCLGRIANNSIRNGITLVLGNHSHCGRDSLSAVTNLCLIKNTTTLAACSVEGSVFCCFTSNAREALIRLWLCDENIISNVSINVTLNVTLEVVFTRTPFLLAPSAAWVR